MTSYEQYSKEELIHKIQELEKEIDSYQTNRPDTAKGFKDTHSVEILNILPDMLSVFDRDYNYVALASSETTVHVGDSGDNLYGKNLTEILPADAYKPVKENFDKVLSTGAPSIGYHNLYVDGVLENFENRVIPLNDQKHILCICRNITEQVKAQNQLQMVISAVNNSMEEIYAVKINGDIVFANKQFKKHYWSDENPEGYKIFEVLPNKTESEWQKFVEKLRERTNPGNQIFQIKINEQIYIQEISAFILKNNTGEEIIWIIGRDITRQKKIEQELIEARLKAEEADKLKSAFLANMSHEIRTPLNAIVGFSNLIAEASTPEEREQYAEIINTNTELLLQLINDILDLSKIEAGTLEFEEKTVALNELCTNIYETLLPRTPENVQLIFDKNPQQITTQTDGNRVAQILSNLINNAQKFTRKGEIHFGYQLQGQTIEFYVKDTGMGIDSKYLDQIFNRFIKLNNFIQGTGLGLPICRMIVENLGGNIQVESNLNQGSEFRFTLPWHPVESHYSAKDRSITRSTAKEEQATILIAEDVESNFLLLKTLLSKEYHLFHAHNGIEALEMYKQHHPDLILMDIKMPELDGLEATRQLRAKSVEVPIIALTAFAFDEDEKNALKAGCNDFLVKPIAGKKLYQMLEKYI